MCRTKTVSELFMRAYMLMGLVVFFPYYNWQHIKEHGLDAWLSLGQVVPTLKAGVWPLVEVEEALARRNDVAQYKEFEYLTERSRASANYYAEIGKPIILSYYADAEGRLKEFTWHGMRRARKWWSGMHEMLSADGDAKEFRQIKHP